MPTPRVCGECPLWEETQFSFLTGAHKCTLFSDNSELITPVDMVCPVNPKFIKEQGKWVLVKSRMLKSKA
jgi:hypothetical protein